jgi:hypothetical protein
MTAHSELGELACRNRQINSISFGGNTRVFSRSMKEAKVFIGGSEDVDFELDCGTGGAGG